MAGKKDFSALSLLFVATLLFYYRFQGISLDGDNLLLLFPMFTLYQFPDLSTWESFISGGSPLVYNIQNATIYPLRWLFYFLPDTFAYNLFTFLHHLLAFVLTYTGLRILKFRVGPSFAGALLFALSGGIQGKFINPVIFFAMVYLPFLLSLTIRAFEKNRLSHYLTGVPIVLALIFHIGNVHTSLYATVLVLLTAVTFLVKARFRNIRIIFLQLAFIGFFTFLLALPTLISLVRMVPMTLRTTVEAGRIFEQQLHFHEIPLSLLGGISTPENLDKTIFVGLIGIFPLFLGLKKFTGLSVYYVIFITGFLLALGQYGLYWFFQFIPVLDKIINPSRALMLSLATLPFFLAWWLDSSFRVSRSEKSRLISLIVFCCSLIFVASGVFFARDILLPPTSLSMLILLSPPAFLLTCAGVNLLGIGLFYIIHNQKFALLPVIGVLLFNGWFFQFRYDYREIGWDEFEIPPHIQYLQTEMPSPSEYRVAGYNYTQLHGKDAYDRRILHFGSPNFMQWFGLEGIQGLNPLLYKDYAQFFELFQVRKPTRVDHELLLLDAVSPLLLDMLSVRYIIGNPSKEGVVTTTSILPPTSEKVLFETDSPHEWKGIGLVNAIDSPAPLKRGETAGRLRIQAEEEEIIKPLRYLEETYDFWKVQEFEKIHSRTSDLTIVNRWPHYHPQRQWMGNYYTYLPFNQPLTVEKVVLENTMPRGTFINYRVIAEHDEPDYFTPGEKHSELFYNPRAYPRFYVPDTIISYEDTEYLKEWITQNQHDVIENESRIVFIQENKKDSLGDPPQSFSLETKEKGKGFYHLSGNFEEETSVATTIPAFPDWHLEIDGEKKDMITVNTAFLGFEVPAGSKDIKLTFLPVPWFLSLAAAIAGLAALIGISIYLKKSSR